MQQKKEPRGRRQNIQITIYPKTGRSARKATSRKKRISRRQTGGFLNRYDFPYAGRDVVNQAGKVAPKLISQATGQINKVAQQRIDQVVRSGWQKLNVLLQKLSEVQSKRNAKHLSDYLEI